jgi:NitT/TauT family transport system permease protein
VTGFQARRELVRGAISVVAGLAIWEVLARALLENELLIPPPTSVARTLWSLAVTGQLNRHFAATATEFACGFAVACIVGVVLGYLMGVYRWFDEVMDPWVAALSSIPVIALVPLIIIWFGVGMFAKIVVVFKIALVAIMVNTSAGIRSADAGWLELARSMRLSRWRTIWRIRLPGALPFIVTGMRLGVGRALLGVVVAELMASQAGLGYLLREASETWDSPKLFATVIMLVAIGLTSFTLLRRAEQRLAPWRRTAEWSTES